MALALGLPCGGWCPKGRRAEDGRIPARYPLVETESADYGERTRRNVRDSDATLVLTAGAPEGGTALSARAARRIGRPLMVVDLAAGGTADAAARRARTWIETENIAILNVAGPRESEAPGIYRRATAFMEALLGVSRKRP